MSRPALLQGEALAAALAGLPGWSLSSDGTALSRRFVFGGFGAAFAFMTRVAQVAEALDHHPDWRNIYRTVDVSLSTHDAGGLTSLDIELAQAMDRIAAQA